MLSLGEKKKANSGNQIRLCRLLRAHGTRAAECGYRLGTVPPWGEDDQDIPVLLLTVMGP